MNGAQYILRLTTAALLWLVPLSTVQAVEVLTKSAEYTDADSTLEKGLFRGKRGKQGKRGKRGHTGAQGAQGEPGTGVTPIYSSHYGVDSSYTASTESAEPIIFTPLMENIEVGGTTFDQTTGEITVPEAGIYEIHADVSFLTTDDSFDGGSAYAELSFLVNNDAGDAGGVVELSKSLRNPVDATQGVRVAGSLTTTVILSANDHVGVVLRPRGTGNTITFTSGEVNFSLKRITDQVP